MKKSLHHFREYIFRGLMALIPLALTVLAVRFIYLFIDQQIIELVDQYIGFRIPGLGIVILLLFLYIVGLIASNVLGKRFFGLIENITKRVPLINTTYQVGKQLSSTLSLPEKQVFQRVILIDYFKAGTMVIGFVTGSMIDRKTNKKYLKVFLPTPPNPTSGIVVMVHEKDAKDPGWTVDEALKMVISGGIIGPEYINT
jgi:uncharacterized membrane protein